MERRYSVPVRLPVYFSIRIYREAFLQAIFTHAIIKSHPFADDCRCTMDSTLTTEGTYSLRGLDFYEEPAAEGAGKPGDDDEGYSPTIERGRE